MSPPKNMKGIPLLLIVQGRTECILLEEENLCCIEGTKPPSPTIQSFKQLATKQSHSTHPEGELVETDMAPHSPEES